MTRRHFMASTALGLVVAPLKFQPSYHVEIVVRQEFATQVTRAKAYQQMTDGSALQFETRPFTRQEMIDDPAEWKRTLGYLEMTMRSHIHAKALNGVFPRARAPVWDEPILVGFAQ